MLAGPGHQFVKAFGRGDFPRAHKMKTGCFALFTLNDFNIHLLAPHQDNWLNIQSEV
jgi:hypothetical protein